MTSVSGMRVVADGVRQLQGFPPNCSNVYLIHDVLVDAATLWEGRRILRQLTHNELRAHVVTHAHADHFGSSHAVCNALDIPLWCGAEDREAIRSGHPPCR
jgi:hydroxyacylglutathione hydrolase